MGRWPTTGACGTTACAGIATATAHTPLRHPDPIEGSAVPQTTAGQPGPRCDPAFAVGSRLSRQQAIAAVHDPASPVRTGRLFPQGAGPLVYAQLTVGVIDGVRVAGGVQRGGLGRGQVQPGRAQVDLELVQRAGTQE